MIQPTLLFIFDSPTQIIFVVAIIFLLFGSAKLPQLAKSIGQTRKAFKEGMREADEEERMEEEQRRLNPTVQTVAAPAISNMSDEELLAEMRRRAELQPKQVLIEGEKSKLQ